MKKRKLGDRINRGFVGLVIVLGSIMIIRFAVAVVKHDVEYIESYRESDFDSDNFTIYPETQDDCAETANGLGVPIEYIDSTINETYER